MFNKPTVFFYLILGTDRLLAFFLLSFLYLKVFLFFFLPLSDGRAYARGRPTGRPFLYVHVAMVVHASASTLVIVLPAPTACVSYRSSLSTVARPYAGYARARPPAVHAARIRPPVVPAARARL